MKRRHLKYLIMGIISALVATFLLTNRSEDQQHRDYPEILASGQLLVTTEYNPIGYFVQGDTLSGFHYELISAFTRDKGLQLKLVPEMDLEKQLEGVNNGTYDLIAGGILVTSESKDSLTAFTVPVHLNKQVLVQRKEGTSDTTLFVHNQLELAGKTLYIPHSSPAGLRIHNLSKEIGDTIFVGEMEKYGAEQLIAMVADGDIDYAVCEAGLVRALIGEYPTLDMQTTISFNQFYAWAVSKQSPALLQVLDEWLSHFKQQEAYRRLLRKYHLD